MGIENLIAHGITPPSSGEDQSTINQRMISLKALMQQQQLGALQLAQAKRAEAFDQNTRDWMQGQMGGQQQQPQLGNIDRTMAGAQPQPAGAIPQAPQAQAKAPEIGVRGVAPGLDLQALIQHKFSIGDVAGAQALQQLSLKNEETRSIAAKNNAQAGDYNAKVRELKRAEYAQALNAALNAPDDQIEKVLRQEEARLVKDGVISPEEAKTQDTFPGRAVLKQHYEALMNPEALTKIAGEQATQQRAAAIAPSQLAESQAKANVAKVKSDQYNLYGTTKAENVTEEGQAAQRAQTKSYQNAELGLSAGRLNLERARNGREQDIYNQTYGPNSNENLRGVEPRLRVQVSAAAQKATDEHTKAAAAQRDMETFLQAAKSGNKEAYAYLSPEGVLTLNTGRGVSRVNRQEIDAYAGAGSLYDQLAGKLGKAVNGRSVSADVLKDIGNLHSSIASNADTTFNEKIRSINQNNKSNYPELPARSSGGTSTGGGVIVQHSESTGAYRHSLDGGKTWLPGNK